MSGDHNKYQKGGVVIDKSAAVRIATSIGWEPKRPWVGLTDEEFNEISSKHSVATIKTFVQEIELKLKEKNT